MSAAPHRDALRLLRREPMLFAMELLWRWSFGLGMLGLALVGYARLRPALILTESDSFALTGSDPTAIAATLLRIFSEIYPEVLRTLVLLAAPAAALWVATQALGRGLLTRLLLRRQAAARVAPGGPHWAGFAVLAAARLLMLLILLVGYLGGVLLGGVLNPSGESPLLAASVALLSLALSWVFWSWVNWLLGLAPLLLARDGLRPLDAIVAALGFAGRNRRELLCITSANAAIRMLSALSFTVLGLLTALLPVPGWLMTLLLVLETLGYCLVSDLFLLARLAAFAGVALREAHGGASAATPAAGGGVASGL